MAAITFALKHPMDASTFNLKFIHSTATLTFADKCAAGKGGNRTANQHQNHSDNDIDSQ
jgi:hypothetical protein